MTLQPKPVGQRPRCLFCQKELRPNYRRESTPLAVQTGETEKVRDPRSYGRSAAEYIDAPAIRATTDAEREQFRKDHPPQFIGTYGGYRDNRFCTLTCGYRWAVAHSKPQV
jgi:hypothetical protein